MGFVTYVINNQIFMLTVRLKRFFDVALSFSFEKRPIKAEHLEWPMEMLMLVINANDGKTNKIDSWNMSTCISNYLEVRLQSR